MRYSRRRGIDSNIGYSDLDLRELYIIYLYPIANAAYNQKRRYYNGLKY